MFQSFLKVRLGRVKGSGGELLRGRWGSKGRPVGKLPPPKVILGHLGSPWVALSRFKLNMAGSLCWKNRSGATPADVSELFENR